MMFSTSQSIIRHNICFSIPKQRLRLAFGRHLITVCENSDSLGAVLSVQKPEPMKPPFAMFKTLLAIALFALMLATQSVSAAVTVSISPGAISNQYTGYITLQISNLISGATVEVQAFADSNSNGVVDSGDLLIQQFQVTDGQAA